MNIGQTIFEQLGGNRFTMMTGAKEFVTFANGIRFKLGRNAINCNRVTITLNDHDLYDIRFSRFLMPRLTLDILDAQPIDRELVLIENVDVSNLAKSFTDVTGLLTFL